MTIFDNAVAPLITSEGYLLIILFAAAVAGVVVLALRLKANVKKSKSKTSNPSVPGYPYPYPYPYPPYPQTQTQPSGIGAPAPIPPPPQTAQPSQADSQQAPIAYAEPKVVIREVVKLVNKPPSLTERQLSETSGTLMWAGICFFVCLVPFVALAEMGVDTFVALLFFMVPAIMGVVGGYMLKRFRTSKAAREFDHDLRTAGVEGVHIGTDGRVRLVAGRRGSTGILHFPNMRIVSDSFHKAVYPFYNMFCAIIMSDLSSPLVPEFAAIAQDILANSDKLGSDGQPKNPRETMYALMKMKEDDETLNEVRTLKEGINMRTTSLADFLDKKYEEHKLSIGRDEDKPYLAEITERYTRYSANSFAWIADEEKRLNSAHQITVDKRNWSFEFDTDLNQKVIGAHLVEHKIINVRGIRDLWPTGGSAVESDTSDKLGMIAAAKMNNEGETWKVFFKWFGPFMLIVGFGILIAMLASVGVIKVK